ncbi:helix-turn-helix domain-containing protein [Bacillus paranthracis]
MKNLKLLRKLLGFTQKSLGEALGVSNQMVKNWELGLKIHDWKIWFLLQTHLRKKAREIIEVEYGRYIARRLV